jgi:hypothetical protein
MLVREIVEKAAYKCNVLRKGASIKGDDAVILVGLLDDLLAELSADNFFNCRAKMIDFDGKGATALTIGETQPDGTAPDVESPRPYNIQSVAVCYGSGWCPLEETDLADLSNVSLVGSSGYPEFFSYEESFPFGTLHFNRGASCRVRIVYSLPFPSFDLNGELPLPPIYKNALVLTLAHAYAVSEGFDEDAGRLLPEMEKAQAAIRANTQKSKPLRLVDDGLFHANVSIMSMR